MLKTRFCELFGIELPIMLAGMGTIALADLAAAVSEAGAMGTVALAGFTPEGIHNEIAAARRLTKKPLACNLLIPFLQPGVAEAAAASPVEAVTLFWGAPAEYIEQFKTAGKKVIWQCGSAEEAADAKRAGADMIIAQGIEAGGHVRGLVPTLDLVPRTKNASSRRGRRTRSTPSCSTWDGPTRRIASCAPRSMKNGNGPADPKAASARARAG